MQFPDFRSVLIVEDEVLLAMMLENIVRDLGAEEVHAVSTSRQAREIALNGKFDCAILDVMLQGQTSYEIADILDNRGIPFIFSSGMSADDLEMRHRHRPFLPKPFADADLTASLDRALAMRRAAVC